MDRKILFILTAVIIVIIVASMFLLKYFTPKFVLASENPDLIFEKIDWNANYVFKFNPGDDLISKIYSKSTTGKYSLAILNETDPTILSPWVNQFGFYFEGPLPEKLNKGIALIPPFSEYIGASMAQNATLPSKPFLIAKIANLADWIDPCKTSCSDVIMRIKIKDLSTGIEETVYENVINSKEGWKTLNLDISKYGNKAVTFKVESFAGGPCGNWCGEWAAIDYLAVGEYV